jgi:hypothetical protein
MEAYPYNSFEYEYYDDLTLEQNLKVALLLLFIALIVYLKFIFFS